MEKFETLTAIAVPVDGVNVDTDQIIPARFLRTPRKQGYAGFLFHDCRVDQQGRAIPDFALNQAAYAGAGILVGNTNFGCGSSREGAVYALRDYGIRCVIAPSLGDIFYNNCLKNGVLPIRLADAAVAALRDAIKARPGTRVTVDLPAQFVEFPDGERHGFAIDALSKRCLLEGLDDIALTQRHASEIAAFKEAYKRRRPWLFQSAPAGP